MASAARAPRGRGSRVPAGGRALVRGDGHRARRRLPRSVLRRGEPRTVRHAALQRAAGMVVLPADRRRRHAAVVALHAALAAGARPIRRQDAQHRRGDLEAGVVGPGAPAVLHAVGRQATALHPAHAESAGRAAGGHAAGAARPRAGARPPPDGLHHLGGFRAGAARHAGPPRPATARRVGAAVDDGARGDAGGGGHRRLPDGRPAPLDARGAGRRGDRRGRRRPLRPARQPGSGAGRADGVDDRGQPRRRRALRAARGLRPEPRVLHARRFRGPARPAGGLRLPPGTGPGALRADGGRRRPAGGAGRAVRAARTARLPEHRDAEPAHASRPPARLPATRRPGGQSAGRVGAGRRSGPERRLSVARRRQPGRRLAPARRPAGERSCRD